MCVYTYIYIYIYICLQRYYMFGYYISYSQHACIVKCLGSRNTV